MKLTILWVGALLIGSLLWGFVMNTAILGGDDSIQFGIGAAVGMGGPVFAVTGVVSGIVYAVTKNVVWALWTWTVLLLLGFTVLGIGAAYVPR